MKFQGNKNIFIHCVPLPGTVHLFVCLMQSVLFFCFLLEVIYRPMFAGDLCKGHIAHSIKFPFFCVILN